MKPFWKRLIPSSAVISLCLAPGLTHADDTQALYAKKCEMCHSIGGKGGSMVAFGGALDATGTMRDADWLRAYLTDPKSKIDGAKMPKIPLDDAQLDGMIAYMLTLDAAAPGQ